MGHDVRVCMCVDGGVCLGGAVTGPLIWRMRIVLSIVLHASGRVALELTVCCFLYVINQMYMHPENTLISLSLSVDAKQCTIASLCQHAADAAVKQTSHGSPVLRSNIGHGLLAIYTQLLPFVCCDITGLKVGHEETAWPSPPGRREEHFRAAFPSEVPPARRCEVYARYDRALQC